LELKKYSFALVPHLTLSIAYEGPYKDYDAQQRAFSERNLDEMGLEKCLLDITKCFPKLRSLELHFFDIPQIFTENGELSPAAAKIFALLCSVSKLSLRTDEDGADGQHPLSVSRQYNLDSGPSPIQISWCALYHAMICYIRRPQGQRVMSSEQLANLFMTAYPKVQDPSFLEDEAAVFDCKTCTDPHPPYESADDGSSDVGE